MKHILTFLSQFIDRKKLPTRDPALLHPHHPLKKLKILATILAVLLPAFVVTGVVYAATTIGTNLSTDGNLTVNGTSVTLPAGSIDNAELANSAVTITAGTGLSGGGTASLGASVTLTNAGVTSAVAGTGIGVSGATGAVTISNTGVTSLTGTANQVTVSGATGAVTLSLPQNIHTGASPTFSGLTLSGLTMGSDTITDFTGSGLAVSTGVLGIQLTTSGNTGASSANSGLEVSAAGLTLLKGCADNQLLKYTDAGGWACAADDSGSSSKWTASSGVIYPNTISNQVGIGTTTAGDVTSSLYVTRNLSSGALGKALAIFNQTENQDILAASSSGTTRFRIANNGDLIATGMLAGLTGLTVSSGTVSLPDGEIGKAELATAAKSKTPATFVVCASDAIDTTRCDYVADGTADNVEIQTAIDALPTNGGKVVLSEGTFNIASAIIYRSAVAISGQSIGMDTRAGTILKPSADVNVFDNTEEITKYNVVIENLHIYGDGANRASGIGIRFYRVREGLIQHVGVFKTRNQGIMITAPADLAGNNQSVGVRLTNLSLYQTGGESIYLDTNASDNILMGVLIRQSQHNGLRISSGGNQVIGCHIYSSGSTAWLDNGTGVGYGITIGNHQNIIMGSQSESNKRDGVIITSGGGS